MSDLCCIVYMSRATRLMSDLTLANILQDARSFNRNVGVTGVLLHHNDIFFQYIEGECGVGNGLDLVYQRIKDSSQHHDIDELLMNMPIEERVFPDWFMGSTLVSESCLLSLKHADWQVGFSGIDIETAHSNDGLDLLLSIISALKDSHDIE